MLLGGQNSLWISSPFPHHEYGIEHAFGSDCDSSPSVSASSARGDCFLWRRLLYFCFMELSHHPVVLRLDRLLSAKHIQLLKEHGCLRPCDCGSQEGNPLCGVVTSTSALKLCELWSAAAESEEGRSDVLARSLMNH